MIGTLIGALVWLGSWTTFAIRNSGLSEDQIALGLGVTLIWLILAHGATAALKAV